MVVFLNNTIIKLDQESSITDFLQKQNISSERGIAIAINNMVVPKKLWSDTKIQENDKITVIKATQGG